MCQRSSTFVCVHWLSHVSATNACASKVCKSVDLGREQLRFSRIGSTDMRAIRKSSASDILSNKHEGHQCREANIVLSKLIYLSKGIKAATKAGLPVDRAEISDGKIVLFFRTETNTQDDLDRELAELNFGPEAA